MKDCKFVIAYENTPQMEGYITEKPFQAYTAGAVPIYNGHAKSIEDINKEALVYSGDFKSNQEMIEYIKFLDSNDEEYCKVWNRPLLIDEQRSYDVVKSHLKKKIMDKFTPLSENLR